MFVAAAVAIAFEAVLRLASGTVAALLLLGTAFASPLLSVASRELWTHGPAALILSLVSFLMLSDSKTLPMSVGPLLTVLMFIRPAAFLPGVVLVVVSRGLSVWTPASRAVWKPAAVAGLGAGAGLLGVDRMLGGALTGYQRLNADWTVWRFPDPDVVAAYLVSPGRGLLLFAPIAYLAMAGAYRACFEKPEIDGATVARGCCAAISIGMLEIASFRHWWGGVSVGPRLLTEYMPLLMILASLAPRHWILRGSPLLLPWALFHGMVAYSGMQPWDRQRKIDRYPELVWDLRDNPFSYVVNGLRPPDFSQGGRLDASILQTGDHPIQKGGDSRWLVYGWEAPEPEGAWAAAAATWHRQEAWLAFRLPAPGEYTLRLRAAAPARGNSNQSLDIEQVGGPTASVQFARGLWNYQTVEIPIKYTPAAIVIKLRARHGWSPGNGDTRSCFVFLKSLTLARSEYGRIQPPTDPAALGIDLIPRN